MTMQTPSTEQQTPAAAAPPTPAAPRRSLLEEIADRTSERYRLGLEPGIGAERDFEDAWDIAQTAEAAGMVGTADEAYARILIGRPLGLPAMASIQGIAFIETTLPDGSKRRTPCMYARTKLAILQDSDRIEYIRPVAGKLTNTSATWVGKRRNDPEPIEYTFTLEDAQIAGLVGRGDGKTNSAGVKLNNYDRHPGPMLQWRACGRLCDILGADALHGMGTREDLEDERQLQKLRELAEEVIARQAPIAKLEEKLAATSAPAARDFAKEALELKTQIGEAIASKDAAAKKRVKEAFDDFAKVAPADVVAEVHTFYNIARGAKSKEKPAPADDPKPADPPPAAKAATPDPARAGDLPVRTLPKCVTCGEDVPGDRGTWVPSANGWRHNDCRPPTPTHDGREPPAGALAGEKRERDREPGEEG